MTRITISTAALIAFLAIAACGGPAVGTDTDNGPGSAAGGEPIVTFEPGDDAGAAAKPSGPITISYRIVGTPVVGQPVAIDLRVSSALGPQPVRLAYRISDSTAMQLAESQPSSISLAANKDTRGGFQQVTVIPMREGRSYLNVSASIETGDGTMSTVTAIPIQVGEGQREMQADGELQIDAEGEALRVLPAKED